ncbi:MAG: hypothetical protein K0B02_04625 [DPANN group archaeon]|nr:hypothetical protein [DPANN group archaeon]
MNKIIIKKSSENSSPNDNNNNDNSSESKIQKKTIKFVLEQSLGIYQIEGKVISVQQTSGPTVFMINDGTGSIEVTAFNGAGVRANPEINSEDIVSILLSIKNQNGRKKNEITIIRKLLPPKEIEVSNQIEENIKKLSEPKSSDFLIESPMLDKMKQRFIEVASLIKRAIIEGRPIIVRHHADTDGYCGGIALQRAIIPLIEAQYGSKDSKWRYFSRSPSKAPFYEYSDVLRDISMALKDMERFGQIEPLIILVDNGSTEEDILAIRKAKIYNAKVIVVDHHYPGEVIDGKSKVDEFLDAHMNPYLFGGDNNLTAGMLCVELARLLNENVSNLDFFPALAGVADRAKGDDFDKYMSIAKEMGFDLDYLKQIALAVDFEAHYLRFSEGWKLVDDLLGVDLKKQRVLVTLLNDEIGLALKNQNLVNDEYLSVEEFDNKVIVGILDTSLTTHRGEFPAPGMATGMAHDSLKDKYIGRMVVTIGLGPFFVTMRISDPAVERGFNVNDLIVKLVREMPYGSISGGGHHAAGSIKFVEGAKDEVFSKIIEEIKKM